MKRVENPKRPFPAVTRLTGWLRKEADYSRDDEVSPDDVCHDTTEPHNIITSKSAFDKRHAPCLDLDRVRLVPSFTPGHYHLFVDQYVSWDDYIVFLKAAVTIGLLEEGYVNASIARGYTALFIPEAY